MNREFFFKEKDLWCRFASKQKLNWGAAKIFEYMQELFFFILDLKEIIRSFIAL